VAKSQDRTDIDGAGLVSVVRDQRPVESKSQDRTDIDGAGLVSVVRDQRPVESKCRNVGELDVCRCRRRSAWRTGRAVRVSKWLARPAMATTNIIGSTIPALSVPDGLEFDELATLLGLAVGAGRELTGTWGDEYVELAVEFDLRDELLPSEVRAAAEPEALSVSSG
jgi:hypothetical protein